MMLRKCPNNGFEDIAQFSIFHNSLRSNIKMLLDLVAGGTMMVVDATKVIDALTSTDYQVQHDRQIESKKGILDHNTSNALLAQKKNYNIIDGSIGKADI